MWHAYHEVDDQTSARQERICWSTDLAAFCFFYVWRGRDASIPEADATLMNRCFAAVAVSERTRRQCVYSAALTASLFTPTPSNVSLEQCQSLGAGAAAADVPTAGDLERRRLACIAGVAFMHGQTERQSAAEAEPEAVLSSESIHLCSKLAHGTARAVCRENALACATPGACQSSANMWELTASILDA